MVFANFPDVDKITWLMLVRCVLASLYEASYVRQSVGRSVCPSRPAFAKSLAFSSENMTLRSFLFEFDLKVISFLEYDLRVISVLEYHPRDLKLSPTIS